MKVAVLLSAYNGEKYIREQIESIFAQTGVELELRVRDDGSRDRTPAILEGYLGRPDFFLERGENHGYNYSFIKLLRDAPEADFYSISDQDDLWHPDKLRRAVDALCREDGSIPLLYASNQNCVDGAGHFLYPHLNPELAARAVKLPSVIFRNYLSGCTMVMNPAMRLEILRSFDMERMDCVRVYDVWFVIAALSTGKLIYDPEATMDFRRHGENATEHRTAQQYSRLERLIGKCRNFFRGDNRGIVRRRAAFVLKIYGERISGEDRLALECIANYSGSLSGKIRLLRSGDLSKYLCEPAFSAFLKVLFNQL